MSLTKRLILALALIAGFSPAFAQAPPPVPALPDTERRTSYSISGTTCACNVGFALYGDSTDIANWLEVFVNGVLITQSGNWNITSPTGPLATIPRPITDAVLTFTVVQTGTVQIVGARRPRRTSQFSESRGVAARDLNQAITDLVAMLRETWDKTNDVAGRAVLAPPGETLALLPVLASRASMGACFNSSGFLTSCVSVPSTTFAAGNGILFTGVSPTTISNNISAGVGIGITGTNPLVIARINLATNPQTGNYTAASTDCGKIILATGGFNTLTLPAASSVPDGCEIGFRNNEVYSGIGTARGKHMVNFPVDWYQTLFPAQAGKVVSNGTTWTTSVDPGRWQLPTSAEICMAQNGLDTNDGLAAGTGCMQTMQAALTAIGQQWDGGGYNSCSIGMYAGGTNIIAGNVNQTGQSVGCYITINVRGNIIWQSTGACFTGGDNSITIINYNLGFIPTFQCNSANTASTGQLKCHQYCVFDINGGTAIWLPGGSNDVFFDLDLQGSATYNATTNVGDGIATFAPATFIQCESHCSKVTVSGSLAFSANVTIGKVFVLRSGSVITTTITYPGVVASGPSIVSGASVLMTNGTTVPGGAITPTTNGVVCAAGIC